MFEQNISIAVQWLIFLGTACFAILTSILMVTRRNPIHSALLLVVTFLLTAVLFLLLRNPFIALIQVLVYAGAVMMLIVFVIMLLELKSELGSALRVSFSKCAAVFTVLLMLLCLFFAVSREPKGASGEYTSEMVGQLGSIKVVGKLLLTDYLLPFEVVSILLLAAIVGAVVLAKQRPVEKE